MTHTTPVIARSAATRQPMGSRFGARMDCRASLATTTAGGGA